MQLSFSAVLQCSCGDPHPINEEANSDNDSEECFVMGSRPSPGGTVEHTLPEDNYQAVGQLTESSAVTETAGQEFEPKYAWGDHVLFWWEMCLFACIKKKPSKKHLCFLQERTGTSVECWEISWVDLLCLVWFCC